MKPLRLFNTNTNAFGKLFRKKVNAVRKVIFSFNRLGHVFLLNILPINDLLTIYDKSYCVFVIVSVLNIATEILVISSIFFMYTQGNLQEASLFFFNFVKILAATGIELATTQFKNEHSNI